MSAAYCRLAPGHPVHGIYHDTEYGFPSNDESVLFERLVLEINQAGLSWLTILKKRAAFRTAFADFKVDRVAAFGSADITRIIYRLARSTPPEIAGGVDAAFSENLSLYRRPDRHRIPAEPRLSAGRA